MSWDYGLICSFLFVASGFLYWGYKKFREPAYNPGDVAKIASEGAFDKQDLMDTSTDTLWKMPGGIDLYHFPVKNKTDDTPILGLHGGPAIAPTEPWKMCELIPNMHLYHARGCGRSTRPISKFPTPGMWPGMKILEETLGIGAQVADIERIRRRLRTEKIHLVGHSFGGFISTMYAVEFPQHVESLSLLAPAAVLKLPTPKGEDGDLFALVEQKLVKKGNKKHIQEYKEFIERYLDFGSLPKETDDSLALRQNEFAIHFSRADTGEDGDVQNIAPGSTGGMACYATFLSMGIEHNYISVCKQRLHESRFPVSIVHGGKDMIPESISYQYASLFPSENTSLAVVSDANHFLYDHPKVITIVKEIVGCA